MKALIIAALLLAGCSTKTPAPFISSTVSTPFSAQITENGDALQVNFQSQKCLGGAHILETQELRIPLGALAQCKPTVVDRLLDNTVDMIIMLGTGFWIGAD